MSLTIQNDYSLRGHNTFGLDCRAATFASYASVAELLEALRLLRGQRLLPIGHGSNLLFTRNFDGAVLHSDICFIEEEQRAASGDNVYVNVGAGTSWDDFCAWAAERGLYGPENLSGIPGQVGAAAVQNVGAYGMEAARIVSQVDTVGIASGLARRVESDACRYGYRDSIFKHWQKTSAMASIVTSVTFRLSRRPNPCIDYGELRSAFPADVTPTPTEIRRAVLSIRRRKLPNPAELGNAGSFFKNPVVSTDELERLKRLFPLIPYYNMPTSNAFKVPAAWLIEQCGWKGRRQGQASVYDRQPLVIVNHGGATSDDILQLASNIQASVEQKFLLRLEPEVLYV